MDEMAVLEAKFSTMQPHLNERQWRMLLGAEARALGRGGVTRVSQAAHVSRTTIHAGLAELDEPAPPPERSRRAGGGRKPQQVADPTLLVDLEGLIDPVTRGDPMSPLRWTCKSTRQLAAALRTKGHEVSHETVAQLLHQLRYSLQAPRKTTEGGTHPDRNAQFAYLNEQVAVALAEGLPVVSVDAKKKELVGDYKNGGQEWQRQGEPELVRVHDFPDPVEGKAIPYGIYDVGRNTGWVNVGQDHDTAQFAVESLRRWWYSVGLSTYPLAGSLLICADGGGSNGSKLRMWKVALQGLANETGLHVTVCHLPPGTSKWNKIEHRLFSYISMNWRGRALVSHEAIVQLIGATTTKAGLRVQAVQDTGTYPTKIKVSDEQLAAVRLRRHEFHGDWNYTIAPSPSPV
jgi:Rhodopirellula transposase DDE domain